MSLSEIQNAVILFSNPVWSGAKTVPLTLTRNLTEQTSQIAYEARITNNLTTLTTTNAETLDGVIQGLLYVPDISDYPACDAQQFDFIPMNVTHHEQLPPTNFNTIAIAPWFSINCTLAYLASVRYDNIRAFIFYKPNNSTNKPQDVHSPVWNLDDNGHWKKNNRFPIFAVSGLEGQKMTTQLSYYSGSIDQAPHGKEISALFGPNPHDYVRIVSSLTLEDPSNLPSLWTYFLIVIGVLVFIFGAVSCTMHFVQRRRRQSLQHRVASGEVDLEAMGIKRLTVPASQVKDFPLYTYNAEPDVFSTPPTPNSVAGQPSPHSVRSSRKSRRGDLRSAASDIMSQRSTYSRQSMRSKRSGISGSVDNTATNFQPNCHICLGRYEHRVSIIRELPCGHIFHPQCVDEFLTRNSSLCPVCKQCMLPRGYSPKITNGMVRRERAVRRLRERVDVEDDSSLESGETKFKEWSKRLFNSGPPATASTDVPMTPIKPPRSSPERGHRSTTTLPDQGNPSPPSEPAPSGDAAPIPGPQPEPEPNAQDPASISEVPAAAKKSRSRKPRPRELNLLPTQPEDEELKTAAPPPGRGSPSAFARERMREIAAKNAPFDDPDQSRPKWRRAVTKVFPGFL